MFLVTGAVPPPDVEQSQCVVLWGVNPGDTSLPRRLKIQEALKRGAKLIVVVHARHTSPPERTFTSNRGRAQMAR